MLALRSMQYPLPYDAHPRTYRLRLLQQDQNGHALPTNGAYGQGTRCLYQPESLDYHLT